MALKTSDRKFIEKARQRFKLAVDQERDIRDEALADVRFRAGDQWQGGIKTQRENEGRPALTLDKTHVFIQAVSNEARQNKPQPKVNPIGGGATTDVANIINGILRHIHYRSQADIASDTALDYATGSSFGFLRVVTEYVASSLDQELRIKAVLDPFAIYGVLIPACRDQKCMWAFVVSTMSKDDYEEKYGTETPQDWDAAEWKNCDDWLNGDNVRVAEYWWVTTAKRTLRMLDAGQGMEPVAVYTSDPGYSEQLPFVLGEDGLPAEREEDVYTVHSCTMDGRRVLPKSETTFAGDSIPIVAVLGQQLIVDGECNLFSLIRFVRDAQRLINIYESAIAEKIGLGNRVPYIGYKGQFKDQKWLDCNTMNYPYLEVEPVQISGEPAPLPQRQQLEEQITSLSNALRQEIDNLKSGMGIYDASLGSRGNETSGVGINARQQQSNVTNLHFADNLTRSIWSLCLIIVKAIPTYYDRPGRLQRIVGEDEEHSMVVLNQPYQDPETGKKLNYSLNVGEYDVVITTGPSYTTARAEGAETLGEFFKAAPMALPLLGDLWVGSLDYPWSREGARRLKAAAPQNIVNDPGQGGGPVIPPQVQQQMAQMGDMMSKLTATVHQLQDEIDSKQRECESRERITAMQEETKRALGMAALDAKKGIVELQAEIEQAQQLLGLSTDQLSQAMDRAHQAGLAAQGHAHDAQQATQQQGADRASQQSAQDATAQQATQAQGAQADQQESAQQAAAQAAALPKAA